MSHPPEEWSTTNNRSAVHPYSLPCAIEVGSGDDWTGITNQKAKKRIQNRVAQRSYRQRVKARLAELQAKVDMQEARSRAPEEDDKPASEGPVPHSSVRIDDRADKEQVELLPSMPQSKDNQTKEPHLNNVNETMSSHDETYFSRDTSTGATAFTTQSRLELRSSLSQDLSDQSCQAYKTLGLDCVHDSEQPHSSCTSQQEGHSSPQLENTRTAVQQATTSASPVILESGENLQSLLDATMETWNPDPYSQSPFSTNAIRSAPQSGVFKPPIYGPVAMSSISSNFEESETPHFQAKNMSLDDRFECIMECVGATGFGNFDALVTAYYNEMFGESSQLSNEQHLSRKRRLPHVLANVFRATMRWTAWERQGFYDEILKATEAILISENGSAWSNLTAGITPVFESRGMMETNQKNQVIPILKKIMLNELPNLWALMMALAASDKPAWQRDCSNAALASILVLHFAGRMDSEKLLGLIRICL